MRLSRQQLQQIFEHSASTVEEVCGILVGQRQPELLINRVIPGRNMHPAPTRHFLLDAASLLHADTLARSSESEIVGFYHSHPQGRALPSSQDRRDAWPTMLMLIVAVVERRPHYLCAWLVDAEGHLAPIVITPA